MSLAELQKSAKQAFQEMKEAEMKMDDIDILTESPLFKKAMEAAKRWHELEDEISRADDLEKCGQMRFETRPN